MHPLVTTKWKPHDVYIGRPSKWGNPFVLKNEVNRADVVRKYIEYLRAHPELVEKAKIELKGKRLACYCAPKLCHGDVLARLAEGALLDELLTTLF